MKYEYSIHYNDVQNKWQVSWTGFDMDRPHSMKGDVVISGSFNDAIEAIRTFAAQLESDRVDAVA